MERPTSLGPTGAADVPSSERIEHTFDTVPRMATLPCVDRTQPVEFPEPYGDATCSSCGLAMYVNEEGKTERYAPPAAPGTYGRGRPGD